jgi:hypothetical protein
MPFALICGQVSFLHLYKHKHREAMLNLGTSGDVRCQGDCDSWKFVFRNGSSRLTGFETAPHPDSSAHTALAIAYGSVVVLSIPNRRSRRIVRSRCSIRRRGQHRLQTQKKGSSEFCPVTQAVLLQNTSTHTYITSRANLLPPQSLLETTPLGFPAIHKMVVSLAPHTRLLALGH